MLFKLDEHLVIVLWISLLHQWLYVILLCEEWYTSPLNVWKLGIYKSTHLTESACRNRLPSTQFRQNMSSLQAQETLSIPYTPNQASTKYSQIHQEKLSKRFDTQIAKDPTSKLRNYHPAKKLNVQQIFSYETQHNIIQMSVNKEGKTHLITIKRRNKNRYMY